MGAPPRWEAAPRALLFHLVKLLAQLLNAFIDRPRERCERPLRPIASLSKVLAVVVLLQVQATQRIDELLHLRLSFGESRKLLLQLLALLLHVIGGCCCGNLAEANTNRPWLSVDQRPQCADKKGHK
jgi:hypothetical protein